MKKLAHVGGVVAVVLATSVVAHAKDDKAAPAADKKMPAAAAPAAGTPAAQPAKPEAAKPAAGAPMKMEPPKPGEPAKPEPAKMEPPKPAPEIDAAFKNMGGTWKCTGQGGDMSTGSMQPMEFSITFKQDLDKFWIVANMATKKSKTMPMVYKFTSYSTFDAATKKWNRVMVDNMGGWETASSAGMTNGQMLWEGKGNGMGMSYTTKHTEQVVSPKEVKLSGQMSVDGKNWMPMYDADCKK